MLNELFELYCRNFSSFRRDENTVRAILDDSENVIIEKRDALGVLVGASVINESTVLMLAVDKSNRGKGIGSFLLEQSEKLIKDKGYCEIKVGAGKNYLLPGVPTSKRYYPSYGERLYLGLDNTGSDFFEKRGYMHSWECNCFDMLLAFDSSRNIPAFECETKDGVSYLWATEKDWQALNEAVREAYPSFCRWYENKELYVSEGRARVLEAKIGEEIAGAIIVSVDKNGIGSAGCTVVASEFRHRGIASNLVKYATAYLQSTKAKEGFIGYTYSGLDNLYGRSGYRICTYYMMAKKELK